MVHGTKSTKGVQSNSYLLLQIDLDKRQTSEPVMVSVVGSIPPGGNFLPKILKNPSM